MTDSEAINLASSVAGAAGLDVSEYDEPTVRFDGTTWRLFYVLRSPGRVGGHFTIKIDPSGQTRLILGR